MNSSHPEFVPALIVVDMQEDFCPPNGALPTPGARALAPTINSLLHLPFAVKAGTQDWHPSNHISFATQHSAPHNKLLTRIPCANPANPAETVPLLLCAEHCIARTPGALLIPELEAEKFDIVIRKGMDARTEMFSGFADAFGRRARDYYGGGGDGNGDGVAVANIDLADYLSERGVTDVYVCGVTGDCCVKCTAVDGARLGFRTWVVEDACATEEEGTAVWGWREARRVMEEAGVRVVGSGDLVGRFGGRGWNRALT
ncbi:MAG: hypothetical protein LQ340_001066 [Diploschistes diacapsis]|nr:MAG: hypothetical protein LQ340_001066 [Diploschistes diacapsis]